MKVLVSTKETQGKRDNDFCWVPEGELVRFPFACAGEEIDGPCGCRRSMSGVKTHKATTTIKVADLALTPDEYEAELIKSNISAGWGENVSTCADDLIEFASQYTVGTILEKRGDVFQPRLTIILLPNC